MKITEEEYNSLVKLTDFLVDMLPPDGGFQPPSVDVLMKLISAWEDENISEPEKVILDEPIIIKRRIFKIGDKSKAICHKCVKTVITTIKESTDKDWAIAGYCDECNTLVSIPHQPIKNKDIIPHNFEPCDHPGCAAHVTHPCEKCGYQSGEND